MATPHTPGASMAGDHGRSAWLADRAHLTPADIVLDVGCGLGAGLTEAAKRGARAIGLDPSATMLRVSARPTEGIALVAATADAVPLRAATVTVAWAVGSLHHWPDIGAGLAEVKRVLAPGGRLFVVEHGAHDRGLVGELEARGFIGARWEPVPLGKRELFFLEASANADRADDPVVI